MWASSITTTELSKIFLEEFKIDNSEIFFLEKYSFTPYPKKSQNEAFYWMSNNLSNFFLEKKINKIIVFGDVNSTFAATIAGYMNKLYIIHINNHYQVISLNSFCSNEEIMLSSIYMLSSGFDVIRHYYWNAIYFDRTIG